MFPPPLHIAFCSLSFFFFSKYLSKLFSLAVVSLSLSLSLRLLYLLIKKKMWRNEERIATFTTLTMVDSLGSEMGRDENFIF